MEEKSGQGTHDLAAWSATVMSNMLFFLSSGMVRECGYPQARHCAREEWYSTVGCCVGCVGIWSFHKNCPDSSNLRPSSGLVRQSLPLNLFDLIIPTRDCAAVIWREAKKQKPSTTGDSRAIPQPSTNPAQPCLSSMF